jgi:hypothetical protein
MRLFSRIVGPLAVLALTLPLGLSYALGREHEGAASKRPGPGPHLGLAPWGEQTLGLQCRIKAPREIEQGMPLEVQIELGSRPRDLPPGVRKLNLFLRDAYLELSLSSVRTGKVFVIKPYEPTAGMPVQDTGTEVVPPDGTALKPWTSSFPLAKLYDTLPPGRYECRVSYGPPAERTAWFRGTKRDWHDAGFWHGTVVSGPLRLKVLKETPKMQTFMFPRRLRLENGKVRFKKEDAEKVEVTVRNGFFVGAYYYRGSEKDWYALGGPPRPDDVNPIDQQVAGKKSTYTIEVFETADRPCHMWHPGPGSGGYKVLWKKTLAVSPSGRAGTGLLRR